MSSPDRSSRKGGDRRPILKFIALFVILIAVFQVLFLTVIKGSDAFQYYLEINAWMSAWILGWFGEEATASGIHLYGPGVALALKTGCDGIQPSGILAAAVLAFPATWRSRLIGIVIGVSVLLAMNLVRVVSLYVVAREMSPERFETFHVTIWPTGFIFMALALWMLWVMKGTPKPA